MPKPNPCEGANNPQRRTCLACDNRHGCRTPEPACLRLERSEAERLLGGRVLMQRRGLLVECEACGLFRRCWSPDEYRRWRAGRGPA